MGAGELDKFKGEIQRGVLKGMKDTEDTENAERSAKKAKKGLFLALNVPLDQ